jgi:hypothetical protein
MKNLIKQFFTLKPQRDADTSNLTAFWLTVAIFFTQIGDFLSTLLGLALGATEQNGLMASLITDHGISTFFGVKVVAAAFLSWVFWKRPAASGFVICLYTAIIANNLLVALGKLG